MLDKTSTVHGRSSCHSLEDFVFAHRFYSFGKEKGVLAKRNLRLLRDDDDMAG